jgi:peptide/nickel transport system permease protein
VSRYVARRLLLAVPTLLGLSVIVFGLLHLAPGDPAEELASRRATGGQPTPTEVAEARAELGLDQPLAVQYGAYLADVARGDLGTSFLRRTSVTDEILQRVPATAQLAVAALALCTLFGLPLGILAAVFHTRVADHALRTVALTGASIPSYFIAYLAIGLFATRLGLVPVAGRAGALTLVLPAAVLALGPTATLSRLLRASMLEVAGEDFVRTGRAKGLPRSRIVLVHMLRNAALPTVTVLGSVFGHLLTGAVIVEFIFAWPGLGRLTLEAVTQRDYPMIQGVILFAGAVFVLLNLLVDLTYPLIDPRVRLEARA